MDNSDDGNGNSIAGPIFISIGDEEKLNLFLDKNPKIPRNQVFVDDYNFDAYKSAGFGTFTDVDKDVAKNAMKNMVAPKLDGGIIGWWKYLTNVIKLSPIPKDTSNMKFGDIPEGVLRLGGTFVVKDDEILSRWNDGVPGDHPNIQEVYQIAKEGRKAMTPAASN